jgi:hypothetical protein
MSSSKTFKRAAGAMLLILFTGLVVSGCNSEEQFLNKPTTEFVIQGYNPPVLDVLWVLDTRSGLTRKPSMHDKLVTEATKFFMRLDAAASTDYQMSFIDMNGTSGQAGRLLPQGGSVTAIHKRDGDLNSRIAYFGALINQVINLNTSAINSGLENARYTLVNNIFATRTNVPLVVIFISDSDDHSTLPAEAAGMSKVDYYAKTLLGLKNNKAELLRVYSINYTSSSDSCATEGQTDMDQSFFPLAQKLNGSTAGLCGTWGDTMDLSGLRLKELPKSFKLSLVPDPSSLQVSIFNTSGPVTGPAWSYDATNNAIVFASAPPDGTTIQFSYNTR